MPLQQTNIVSFLGLKINISFFFYFILILYLVLEIKIAVRVIYRWTRITHWLKESRDTKILSKMFTVCFKNLSLY